MSYSDSSLFDSSLDVSFLTPTKPLSASYLPAFVGVSQLFDPLLAVTPEQAALRAKQVRFNPAVTVKETSYFAAGDGSRSPQKLKDCVGREIEAHAAEVKSSPVKNATSKRVSPTKQGSLPMRAKTNVVDRKASEADIDRNRKATDAADKATENVRSAVRSLNFVDKVDFTKVEYNSSLRTIDVLRSLESQLKTGSDPLKVTFDEVGKKAEINERSGRALNIASDRAVFRELPGVEVTRSELERAKAVGRRTHDAANRELLRAAAQRNAALSGEDELEEAELIGGARDAEPGAGAGAPAIGDEPTTDERPSLAFRSIRHQLAVTAPCSCTPRAFEFLSNLVW